MKFSLALILLALLASSLLASDHPVVFWASDSVKPGDAILLYGDGLSPVLSVDVKRIADNGSTNTVAVQSEKVQTLQPCNASLKFLMPASLEAGIYAVEFKGAKPVLINRPQLWFMQPERLEPGLVQNQAPPRSKDSGRRKRHPASRSARTCLVDHQTRYRRHLAHDFR